MYLQVFRRNAHFGETRHDHNTYICRSHRLPYVLVVDQRASAAFYHPEAAGHHAADADADRGVGGRDACACGGGGGGDGIRRRHQRGSGCCHRHSMLWAAGDQLLFLDGYRHWNLLDDHQMLLRHLHHHYPSPPRLTVVVVVQKVVMLSPLR